MTLSDKITPIRIQRERSRIERAGQVLALCVAMTTLVVINWSPCVLIYWPGSTLAPGSTFFQWGVWFVSLSPGFVLLAAVQQHLPARPGWRAITLVALVLASMAIGYGLHFAYSELCLGEGIAARRRPMILHTIGVGSALFALLAECRRRQKEAAEALHEVTVNELRLQAELLASHLQLLTAQIEPHFLFNSLANVRRLLRTNGPAGREMLLEMMRYLEAALPHIREERPTLAREFELVRAFLAVQKVRFGRRLDVQIALPPALATRIVPPLMLLTLVENALKHGIAPLIEGGLIRVDASEEDGQVHLRVADTGRGLRAGTGRGVGLANVRARLRAAYGANARFSMQLNEPRGIVATIDLPSPT